jgi:transposase
MKKFTDSEKAEITEAVKNVPERGIGRKIMAMKMSAEGLSNDEISKMTGYSAKYIYEIVAEYQSGGMESLRDKRVGGNHRSMSEGAEAGIFEGVRKEAEEGKYPRAKEIKKAVEEAAGKEIPQSTFYGMMKRQKGRKVKPRGSNPKAADKKKRKTRNGR